MKPAVIVVKDGVVDEAILCQTGEEAETLFLKRCASFFSNWDEYSQEDIDEILEQGYEKTSLFGSVCLTWMEETESSLDEKLIDLVLEQIKSDNAVKDWTAIVELLKSCPVENLKAFLSEE